MSTDKEYKLTAYLEKKSCHVRQWLWLWAGVYVSLFYATLKFQLFKKRKIEAVFQS